MVASKLKKIEIRDRGHRIVDRSCVLGIESLRDSDREKLFLPLVGTGGVESRTRSVNRLVLSCTLARFEAILKRFTGI